MTKVFCPNCGNRTLKKVAVSLKEDGTQVIHISSRKRLSARGKRVSKWLYKCSGNVNLEKFQQLRWAGRATQVRKARKAFRFAEENSCGMQP
jgi:hypothetical protein